MGNKKELYIDAAECTGCEYCIDKLPSVFTLNSDGISTIVDQNGADEKAIQKVMDNCPAECMFWK